MRVGAIWGGELSIDKEGEAGMVDDDDARFCRGGGWWV